MFYKYAWSRFFFFKQVYLFIYLFLTALGFRCCTWAFFSCIERGLLFIAVRGLLIAVASPVVERGWAQQLWHTGSVVVAHGLSSCGSRALERRFSSCGAWAQLLHSMWDLPGLGLKPVSPALVGGFLTTVPPGKPHGVDFNHCLFPPLDTKRKQDRRLK